MVLVVDLDLKGRKGLGEGLHFFKHCCLVLVAGVGHFGELMLHLLLYDPLDRVLVGASPFGILLGYQSVDDLVDEGGEASRA